MNWLLNNGVINFQGYDNSIVYGREYPYSQESHGDTFKVLQDPQFSNGLGC